MPDIAPVQNGLRMVGDNFSDDLFFFIKRKIEGLLPNTKFQIIFSIDIVTNMPPNAIGGADLMLKAGATIIEPQKIIIDDAGIPYYRMNINKDNQSQSDAAMDTLGHINHNVPDNFNYHLVNYKNEMKPFEIPSDSNGEIWVIIGAESQFETTAEFLVANIEFTLDNITSIEEPKKIVADFELFQNYPNPFNPVTTIQFDLLKTSDVTLKIFNSPGEEVATLVSDRLSTGNYSYNWSRPAGMASGVYLYRLEAGDFVETKKMILLR